MSQIFVDLSDERMNYLKTMLDGIDTPQQIYVFAPNTKLNSELTENLVADSIVVGGKIDLNALSGFKAKNIVFYNILDDERFQALNARLTAEGALAVILTKSPLGLKDTNSLIIGFGRIGAALASCFQGLKMNFDIATTNSIRPAFAFANNVIQSKNFDFSAYDIIINTAPAELISEKEIRTTKKSALYIDLATMPAVDLNLTKYLGLDADVYPALPAKYSPHSAAIAMKEFLFRKLSL